MALTAGTKLGSYEVVAQIGAGGMGEVYQAHDTKLGRDVAIKVLPEAFAHDPERLARFQREAKMLASLNHPNIATIYGLEQSGGTSYLVMELVSGETLAERVKRDGAVPIEEALAIAKQIAEALEAAHEKDIIHRDLKPANVKVTPEGKVKVLDFGLAKAFEGDAATEDMSNSPTLSRAATMQGVILGTAAYMSPEQARGKAVDKRTDIWAFGCVLYELLTGKQTFHGEDVTDILAAVVRADPDWNRFPATTPPAIRNLLRRCLQKDAKKRLRDAGDTRIEIEEALSGPAVAEAVAPTSAAPQQRPFGWIAAAVLLLALTALSFVHFRETQPEQRSIHFQMRPPEKTTFGGFRLSPDGRQITFMAQDPSGKSMLWVRSLDTLAAQSLAGTDGATYPFWSPDSTQIAFFAYGKLRKIAAAGGPALTICDAVNGRGGTWNRDGVIIFTPTIAGGLYRVSDAGGAPVPVTKVADAGDNDRFPEFLPDGRRFLFFRGSPKDSGIYVGSLDGMAPVRILSDESNAQYVASGGARGYLLLRRENTLVAQPFDSERLKITGGIVPIAEYVGIAGNSGYGAFSASRGGTLAYGTGNGSSNRQLVWLDRTGNRLSVISKPDAIGDPALSPKGKTVAFVIGNMTAGSSDIWLQDLERGALSRFTFGPGANGYPVWSPDGRSIVFTATATSGGSYDIYQKPASGVGSPELLFHGGSFSNSTDVDDWSADGKFIVFSNRDEKTKDDLWLLPMEGDRKRVPFLQTPSNENLGQFSPDSKWLAYQSDETGRYEIYVQHVPPNGAKFQISATGGTSPRWRRDGKELFYLAPGPKLMALSVKTGAFLEPAQPRVLFENVPIATAAGTGGFRFQPSPDGQRFLALVEAEGDVPAAPPNHHRYQLDRGVEEMSIAAGTKLGSYEVVSQIGAGGMGEVYQAHDTKLGRDVAIKVLPEAFAHDVERLSRFQREAKMLAALNHPNIATIHGLDQSGSTSYLVMELVSGETLADRVKRDGAVPIEEALGIAKQIAEALEAAHEKGIIHRDLKPANVKLTPEGKVKVLDFGLAKAFAGDASTEDMGNSPTLSMAATMQGVILGTAAYMSPEQAKDKAVDKRTDIFAFGAVMYELLTGKQAFHGDDVTDILSAVLRMDPDWNRLPSAVPQKIRDLLRRCLEKDSRQRFHDAADVRIEIEDAIAAPKDSAAIQAAPASTSKLPWVVATALLIVAAVMAFLYFQTSPSPEESIAKFSVLPPPNVTLVSEFAPVISPDGKKLAFIARDASGKTMLWVRQIDSLAAQPIAGTESAQSPFWAPDSSSIAFLYQTTLKRVDLVGGATRTLCEANTGGQGGTWGSDGVILLGSTGANALLRVPSGGGTCQAGTELNRERQERTHVFPEFLPDGRHFLYLARSNKKGNTGVMVGSLDSKEAKFVLPCSSQAVYAYGYLLFVRDQTLMAQRFDTGHLELSGEAFPVVEQIAVSIFGDGMFSASSNGVLAFRSGTSENSQLTWFDRSGKLLGSVGPAGEYVNLALSTDGKRVVFQRQNSSGHRDIWQMEIDRPVPQRVTFSASDETNPIYSPDGATIVFASNREGPTQLFEKPSSGVGTDTAVVRTDGDSIPIDWSADGHFLIFRMVNKQGINEGWVLPMTGERKPFGYLQSNDLYQNLPRLSPNGRWLAYYASGSTGLADIFLQSFPKPGGKWQVSKGINERWSRDGKELFYLASNGQLMAVTVKGETAPEIGSPVALFAPTILGGVQTVLGYRSQYDVAPDGRFLIIVPVDEGAGSSMTVVLNWAAGLKK